MSHVPCASSSPEARLTLLQLASIQTKDRPVLDLLDISGSCEASEVLDVTITELSLGMPHAKAELSFTSQPIWRHQFSCRQRRN